jgi:hypothetical protein
MSVTLLVSPNAGFGSARFRLRGSSLRPLPIWSLTRSDLESKIAHTLALGQLRAARSGLHDH